MKEFEGHSGLIPEKLAYETTARLMVTRESIRASRMILRCGRLRASLLSFVWYQQTCLWDIFNYVGPDEDYFVSNELSAFRASYPWYPRALGLAIECPGVLCGSAPGTEPIDLGNLRHFAAPAIRMSIRAAAQSALESGADTSTRMSIICELDRVTEETGRRRRQAIDSLKSCTLEWIPRSRVMKLTGIPSTTLDRRLPDRGKRRGHAGGRVEFKKTEILDFITGWTPRSR